VIVGVYLALFPAGGALALTLLIGAYAVGFGVLLVIAGMRLRGWRREARRANSRARTTA
jgi:uncharacterized membrane protein HdeD (DUF308 family)